MATLTRITDEKARVSLPKRFADMKVLIEEVGDSELRIRKAGAAAKTQDKECRFIEEEERRLSPAAA